MRFYRLLRKGLRYCFSLFLVFRPEGVKADFSIDYNVQNFSLIEELNKSMSETGRLHNMSLQLINITGDYGKLKSSCFTIGYISCGPRNHR